MSLEIFEDVDNLEEIFDDLYYLDKDLTDAIEGHILRFVDSGTEYYGSSWMNWVIFKIDDEEQLYRATRDADSWDSNSWEGPVKVVAKQVTYTDYVEECKDEG